MGEDVGSLEGLGPEAEDVVDYEDGAGCRGGTGRVWGLEVSGLSEGA